MLRTVEVKNRSLFWRVLVGLVAVVAGVVANAAEPAAWSGVGDDPPFTHSWSFSVTNGDDVKQLPDPEVPPMPPQQQQVNNGSGKEGQSGSVQLLRDVVIAPRAVEIGGKRGWAVSVPGSRALATPAIEGNTVYVGGGFGSYEFYAFDVSDGRTKWAVRVSDDGPTAAVVKDGYVAFNTESCTLFVLRARDGGHVWSRWLGDPLMSQPAIADGKVFMAYPGRGGHRLAAFELSSGKPAWETGIAGDIISAPIIYGNYVHFTTFDGTVYKYSARDGSEIWKRFMNATSAPWIDGSDVYVSRRIAGAAGAYPTEGIANLDKNGEQKNNELWGARDAPYLDSNVQGGSGYARVQKSDDSSVGFSTGPSSAKLGDAEANIGQGTVRGLWEYQGSRPVYSGGRLYVSFGDAVACIEPKTEKVIWERKLDCDLERVGGHGATPPALAGDRLYVGTADGWLLVYAQMDGSLVWKGHVGEPIRYQPAIMDGKLFVGTTSGSLIVLDLGDRSATGWAMWGSSPSHN